MGKVVDIEYMHDGDEIFIVQKECKAGHWVIFSVEEDESIVSFISTKHKDTNLELLYNLSEEELFQMSTTFEYDVYELLDVQNILLESLQKLKHKDLFLVKSFMMHKYTLEVD